MSLYAISSELELILDAILEGGADSPEGQQALEAHLAGLDAALDDKADRVRASNRVMRNTRWRAWRK
mgnify:CR=1 FL=1